MVRDFNATSQPLLPKQTRNSASTSLLKGGKMEIDSVIDTTKTYEILLRGQDPNFFEAGNIKIAVSVADRDPLPRIDGEPSVTDKYSLVFEEGVSFTYDVDGFEEELADTTFVEYFTFEFDYVLMEQGNDLDDILDATALQSRINSLTERRAVKVEFAEGVIVDNYTDPDNPDYKKVVYEGGQAVPQDLTWEFNHVSLKPKGELRSDGTYDAELYITETIDFAHHRDYVYLGSFATEPNDKDQINALTNYPYFVNIDLGLNFTDFMEIVGVVKEDNSLKYRPSQGVPGGLKRTASRFYLYGAGFKDNAKVPSIVDIKGSEGENPDQDVFPISYTLRNPDGSFKVLRARSELDGVGYDDGSGELDIFNLDEYSRAQTPEGKWTVQHVFTQTDDGSVLISYGQHLFDTPQEAWINRDLNYQISDDLINAHFSGWLLTVGGNSDYTDKTKSIFIDTDVFGKTPSDSDALIPRDDNSGQIEGVVEYLFRRDGTAVFNSAGQALRRKNG